MIDEFKRRNAAGYQMLIDSGQQIKRKPPFQERETMTENRILEAEPATNGEQESPLVAVSKKRIAMIDTIGVQLKTQIEQAKQQATEFINQREQSWQILAAERAELVKALGE